MPASSKYAELSFVSKFKKNLDSITQYIERMNDEGLVYLNYGWYKTLKKKYTKAKDCPSREAIFYDSIQLILAIKTIQENDKQNEYKEEADNYLKSLNHLLREEGYFGGTDENKENDREKYIGFCIYQLKTMVTMYLPVDDQYHFALDFDGEQQYQITYELENKIKYWLENFEHYYKMQDNNSISAARTETILGGLHALAKTVDSIFKNSQSRHDNILSYSYTANNQTLKDKLISMAKADRARYIKKNIGLFDLDSSHVKAKSRVKALDNFIEKISALNSSDTAGILAQITVLENMIKAENKLMYVFLKKKPQSLKMVDQMKQLFPAPASPKIISQVSPPAPKRGR